MCDSFTRKNSRPNAIEIIEKSQKAFLAKIFNSNDILAETFALTKTPFIFSKGYDKKTPSFPVKEKVTMGIQNC